MKPSHLLTCRKLWAKYANARDAFGEACGVWSPSARSWDLEASISRYTGLPLAESEGRIRATDVWAIWAADNARSQYPCQQTLGGFNDTTTFEWIALALKQANL
jgi:hypothetical protein